jgi:hypothetical protein
VTATSHVEYCYSVRARPASDRPLDRPATLTAFFHVNAAPLLKSNAQRFASFAPKLQSDWFNLTGQKIDGVIALDFTAVEAILNITGP